MPFADSLTGSYSEYSADRATASPIQDASANATTGNNPLGIGPVAFTIDEHPEKLSFGLTQAQATHRYIGGGVNVQTLGPQPKDVEWSGMLRGPTVLARSRLLKRLCAQGQVLSLTYIDESYDVLIIDVEVSYLRAGRADYHIVVRVLRDTSGAFASATAPSIDSQVGALYANAQGTYNKIVSVDSLAEATLKAPIDTLGVTISKAGPIAQLTGDNAKALLGAASKAVSSAQSYAAAVGLGSQWGKIADAVTLTSQLQCVVKNVTNGQAQRTDTLFGGDFWDLSSKWYGTPEFAQALAAANGRKTPRVAPGEVLTVIIPPLASIGRG